jgi:uncharacterized protein YjdB
MTKLVLTIFTLLGLGLWSACADAPTANTPDEPELARLELFAPTTTLDPGATMTLTVAAFDADGGPFPTPPITWASSADSIVTVTPTGDVTAHAAGTARIIASSGSIVATIDLAVRETIAVVDRVEILTSSLVLAPGAGARLEAVAYDAEDNVLPGRGIAWTSDDPAVAVVSTEGTSVGELTAVAPGSTTIFAHCEGARAQIEVRVQLPVARLVIDAGTALDLRPAQTRQLVATAHAADDSILTERDVSWSIDATSVATITEAGLVTAQATGTAIVTATAEGIAAHLTVTVRVVDRIQLNLTAATIDLAAPLQVTAHLFDAEDQPIQDFVTWSSDHPEIATVDASGLVVGQREGAAIITATSGGASASVAIQVAVWTEWSLATVDGAPAPATLYSYTTQLGGVEHQLEMVAVDGVLATRAFDGRYELMVFGPVFVDGVEAGFATHTSAGAMVFDPQQELFRFVPDSIFIGSPFTGRLVGTDLVLSYQPDQNAPPATLVFAGA